MEFLDTRISSFVSNEMELAGESYQVGEFGNAIRRIESAWAALPEPKTKWDISYQLSKCMVQFCLECGEIDNARLWAKTNGQCDLQRLDDGEREAIAGRVEFAGQNFDDALRLFCIADSKSHGRWINRMSPEIKKFFLNNKGNANR